MKTDKRCLVYTSDKHYILAYTSDMDNNAVSRGVYVNDGYGRGAKKDLKTTVERLAKMKLLYSKSNKVSFDGTKLKTIPFYKDVKVPMDKFGGQYKYTYVKELELK